jgi:membrane fusion protein (multidrug efflux system)
VASPFSRSLRSLAADGLGRSAATILAAAAVLAAWAAWFFAGDVGVYVASETARLEVERAAHPVEALVAGRVAASSLVLGRDVEAGEVLVELDAEEERARLAEAHTRLEGAAREIEALAAEAAAQARAAEEDRRAAAAALDAARRHEQEAARDAAFREEELARIDAAHSQGGVFSDDDLRHARDEAERRRAALDAARIEVTRLEFAERTREGERAAKREELARQAADAEARREAARAAGEALTQAVEKRRIRAPTAGRVEEAAPVHAGMVVREGERLGAVLPAGGLKIVAQFAPAAALGRVRPGQRARVRLEGFPWTQYGSLAARVASVAGEPREGLVRVELAVEPDPSSRIPLQHGLPGTAEVEVERVAPAVLVLRAAGRLR